jgi:hypothetical protein
LKTLESVSSDLAVGSRAFVFAAAVYYNEYRSLACFVLSYVDFRP